MRILKHNSVDGGGSLVLSVDGLAWLACMAKGQHSYLLWCPHHPQYLELVLVLVGDVGKVTSYLVIIVIFGKNFEIQVI